MLMIQYIIIVYTLIWLKIKRSRIISQPPLHIFETYFQSLPLQARDIVLTPMIERNAYGDHY